MQDHAPLVAFLGHHSEAGTAKGWRALVEQRMGPALSQHPVPFAVLIE